MDRYCKRLIEVDLPIKRISAHARREKSIRYGHIMTLHNWWARRPLASCRAVICAAMWPDPADDLCPDSFRQTAKDTLIKWANCSTEQLQSESLDRVQKIRLKPECLDDGQGLRAALLDFIADFANWDNTINPIYLEACRTLTKAAHEALGGVSGTKPLIADPFAGGGSIPLESLRIGSDVFASDLNPVPVLLNKIILEYIPKYGKRLSEEVRKWGGWVKNEAAKELAEFYPNDKDGARPIAYLWARTIQCEGPACGAEIPLVKSLWLGKKAHNSWSLRLIPNNKLRRVDFDIVQGAKLNISDQGTIKRASAICLCCGFTTPIKNVRKQLASREGGTSTARLFCVVTIRPGEQGRFYRLPTEKDLEVVGKAESALRRKQAENICPFNLIPDEPLPPQGTLGFRVQLYGIKKWGQLFSSRQALVLATLTEKVREVREQLANIDEGLAEATQGILALNVDKMSDYGSALASWQSPASQEKVRNTFSRQTLSMVWDFAEAYPFANSSGGWTHNLNFLVSPLDAEAQAGLSQGVSESTSATCHPLSNDCVDLFATDPPYYDAIPYADLSDFFIVWLRRSLEGSDLAKNFSALSPKDEECVVDEIKGHDGEFFRKTMEKALAEGRRITRPEGLGIVVFAHKSTAGWEGQLQAMIDAGWIITASWPIDTEMANRLRAQNSAVLGSSVHIVCRPRENPDGSVCTDDVGDWRDVLQELPRRIHEWMPRLAEEGVVGADAIFACLGPALEIFSRYSSVERASGEKVSLKEYLEEVWAAVSREALNMIFEDADASGFEEDARLTAMWLWTLRTSENGMGTKDEETDEGDVDAEQPKKTENLRGYSLEYDAARKIAQGLGAHLENLSHLVEVKGARATLLSAAARTKYLFGKEAADAPQGQRKKKKQQLTLDFDQEIEELEETGSDWATVIAGRQGTTVLDQVHQAMILFGAGRGEALRRFLVEDGVGRNPLFWRLPQALSSLYPVATDEKRWVDGVLARKKGLGL